VRTAREVLGLQGGSSVHCAYSVLVQRQRWSRLLANDRYMSHYPLTNRVNFFRTVDLWQSTFILAESNASSDTGYASSSQSAPGLLSSLTPSITQLLMAEPSLLENQDIAAFIDRSISSKPSTPLSNLVALGLTPLLVRLLRSPELDRRKWAFIQMQAAARRKLSFESAVRTGVRDEIEELCRDPAMDEKERWKIVKTILKKGCLDQEAVEKGLLVGQCFDGKIRKGKGIMAILAPLLGAESDCKSESNLWNIAQTMQGPDHQTSPSCSTLYSSSSTSPLLGHSGHSTRLLNSLTLYTLISSQTRPSARCWIIVTTRKL
jgi:hypothetical protein